MSFLDDLGSSVAKDDDEKPKKRNFYGDLVELQGTPLKVTEREVENRLTDRSDFDAPAPNVLAAGLNDKAADFGYNTIGLSGKIGGVLQGAGHAMEHRPLLSSIQGNIRRAFKGETLTTAGPEYDAYKEFRTLLGTLDEDRNEGNMDIFERSMRVTGDLAQGMKLIAKYGVRGIGQVAQLGVESIGATLEGLSDSVNTLIPEAAEGDLQWAASQVLDSFGVELSQKAARAQRIWAEGSANRGLDATQSEAITQLSQVDNFSEAMGFITSPGNLGELLADSVGMLPEFAGQFAGARFGRPGLVASQAMDAFGGEIYRAQREGTNFDTAFERGFTAMGGAMLAGEGGIQLAKLRVFKPVYYDTAARVGLQAAWEVGSEQLSRWAMNDGDMRVGEMLVSAGMEAMYGAPVDFYVARQLQVDSGEPLIESLKPFKGDYRTALPAIKHALMMDVFQTRKARQEMLEKAGDALGTELIKGEQLPMPGIGITSTEVDAALAAATGKQVTVGKANLYSKVFEQDYLFAKEQKDAAIESLRNFEETGDSIVDGKTKDRLAQLVTHWEATQLRFKDNLNVIQNRLETMTGMVDNLVNKLPGEQEIHIVDYAATDADLNGPEIYTDGKRTVVHMDLTSEAFWKTETIVEAGKPRQIPTFDFEAFQMALGAVMGRATVNSAVQTLPTDKYQKLVKDHDAYIRDAQAKGKTVQHLLVDLGHPGMYLHMSKELGDALHVPIEQAFKGEAGIKAQRFVQDLTSFEGYWQNRAMRALLRKGDHDEDISDVVGKLKPWQREIEYGARFDPTTRLMKSRVASTPAYTRQKAARSPVRATALIDYLVAAQELKDGNKPRVINAAYPASHTSKLWEDLPLGIMLDKGVGVSQKEFESGVEPDVEATRISRRLNTLQMREDFVTSPEAKKKYTPQERIALNKALTFLDKEKLRHNPTDLDMFARIFDKHMQIEMEVKTEYDNLSPLRKWMTKKPVREPAWNPLTANIARHSAVWRNLLQQEMLSPDDPHLQAFVAEAKGFHQTFTDLLSEFSEDLLPIIMDVSSNEQLKLFQVLNAETQRGAFFDKEIDLRRGATDNGVWRLGEKALLAYDAIREHMKRSLMHVKAERIEAMRHKNMSDEDIAAVAEEFDLLTQQPYMPPYRFGMHLSTIRAGEDISLVRRTTKTADEAASALDQLDAQLAATDVVNYKAGDVIAVVGADTTADLKQQKKRAVQELQRDGLKLSQLEKDTDGSPRWTRDIKIKSESIDKSIMDESRTRVSSLLDQNIDPKLLREQTNAEALADSALPELSKDVRSFIKRKAPFGASNDGIRALASYQLGLASSIAYKRHIEKMKGVIQSYSKEIEHAMRNTTGEDGALKGLLIDKLPLESYIGVTKGIARKKIMREFMRDKMAEMVSESGNIAQNLSSAGFIYALALNPKSWFINLTQVPVVGLPYLTAQVGSANAVHAFPRAITDLARLWQTMDQPTLKERFRKAGLTEGEWEMMDLGVRNGILDQSLAKEILDLANNTVNSRAIQAKLSGAEMSWFSAQKIGGLFALTEKMNRNVMFLASIRAFQKANPKFDLEKARKDGVTGRDLEFIKQEVYKFGQDAIDNTMFEYSRWNRSKFASGVGRPVFLFATYAQNLLFQMTKFDKAGRRIIMAMLAAGGAQAMPFVPEAEEMTKAVAKMMGSDFDPRVAFMQYANRIGMPGEMLIHGGSRYGFGLSHAANAIVGSHLPEFDVSGSFRSNVPIVSQGVSAISEGVQGFVGKGSFENVVMRAAQTLPLIGMAGNIGRHLWNNPDTFSLRTLEGIAPRGFLEGALASYRLSQDKRETTLSGKDIFATDYDLDNPEHMSELWVRALGFRSTRVTQARDERWYQKERQFFFEAQRDHITRRFRHEFMEVLRGNKDANEWKRIAEDLAKWNSREDVPWKYKIRSTTLKRSLTQHFRAKMLERAGLVSGDLNTFGPQFDELRVYTVPENAEGTSIISDTEDD